MFNIFCVIICTKLSEACIHIIGHSLQFDAIECYYRYQYHMIYGISSDYVSLLFTIYMKLHLHNYDPANPIISCDIARNQTYKIGELSRLVINEIPIPFTTFKLLLFA